MRHVLIAVLIGCGGSEVNAPDDCVVGGELHIVHGSLDERLALGNFAFVNVINDNPGTLAIGSGATNAVQIEFLKIATRGDTVDASGSVTLPSGLDVGNCASDGRPGLLFVSDDLWRFELRQLRTAPYCEGAEVTESLGGCYRAR